MCIRFYSYVSEKEMAALVSCSSLLYLFTLWWIIGSWLGVFILTIIALYLRKERNQIPNLLENLIRINLVFLVSHWGQATSGNWQHERQKSQISFSANIFANKLAKI